MARSKILIVDDDDDVRESLVDELCNTYEVDAVASGDEALVRFAEHSYDAIISDLRMPGMNGIQVLEQARERDPEIIRILLTGYLDEDAHEATMQKDAPFKVGKPWHDELEVTLRRAFEFRDTKRSLTGSVFDALAVAGIDDELSVADGLSGVAKLVVRRVKSLEGVDGCSAQLDLCGTRRLLAGDPLEMLEEAGENARGGDRWFLREPLSTGDEITLHVTGTGDNTRDIVRFIAQRARQWVGDDEATRLARKAAADPHARERLTEVSRRATLGAMTAAIVHELASIVQSLQGAVYDLDFFVREVATEDPEVLESLDTVSDMSKRMVSLFRAMRTFVRSGQIGHRSCHARALVERSVALTRGYTRSQAFFRLGDIADVEVDVSEPLFLQVLVNVLRNAIDASPSEGKIDVEVTAEDDWVRFHVTDDGAGVPDELVDALFEPFVTSKDDHDGSGLGLAISAQIVADHGGGIDYQRAPDRGARFTVTLPRARART